MLDISITAMIRIGEVFVAALAAVLIVLCALKAEEEVENDDDE